MFKTDIAFKSDINRGFLPFITAFMVFLASIIFATAIIGNSIAGDWDRQVSNTFAIQVLPDMKSKNPGKEIEERIKNVLTLLKQTPGIKSSSAMSLADTQKLLKPWLGDIADTSLDMPLPRIIAVEVSDVIPLNAKSLEKEIKSYSSLVTLEAYEDWMEDFKHTLRAAQTLLGLIVILILATTGVTISYATRSGLSSNRDVIEIMHLVGAENGFISRQFSARMTKLSFMGGAVGYAIACLAVLTIGGFTARLEGGIIAGLDFGGRLYLYMLLVPAAAAAITKLTAAFTINKALDRME
jgi:cell division transport system permease protein